jgi:8-oxo-dGTP pyrophosphatase MutT (NUDIX family)
LVHPGGPFWSKKDDGAWSIPKGEYREDENPFEVAKRELKKETGYKVYGNFIPLLPIKQPSSPKASVMPNLIRHPEKPTSWFHVQTGFRPWVCNFSISSGN